MTDHTGGRRLAHRLQPALRRLRSGLHLGDPRVRPPGGAALWLAAAAFGLALLALIVAISAHGRDRQPPGAIGVVGPTIATGSQSAAPAPAGSTAPPPARVSPRSSGPGQVDCPPSTVTVNSADSLTDALETASPGASILLEDGVYTGRFRAATAGTATSPIFLCGGAGAILDGDGIKEGYGLHLDGASYWRVVGFTIRNSQKGLMADKVERTLIQGLTVEQIGDEAIHLRNFSSDNIVEGNTIRGTGKRQDKFGEGIYIGSAESNWCEITDCKPDRSDRNTVRANNISDSTAESIDIKEGTTGGVLSKNTFDGTTIRGGKHADSWVDVKGNDWLIEGNTGHSVREDGFQTHEVAKGWGTNNVFKTNKAEVNGAGWGFHLTPAKGNTVHCDNTVTGAAKGFANVECTS